MIGFETACLLSGLGGAIVAATASKFKEHHISVSKENILKRIDSNSEILVNKKIKEIRDANNHALISNLHTMALRFTKKVNETFNEIEVKEVADSIIENDLLFNNQSIDEYLKKRSTRLTVDGLLDENHYELLKYRIFDAVQKVNFCDHDENLIMPKNVVYHFDTKSMLYLLIYQEPKVHRLLASPSVFSGKIPSHIPKKNNNYEVTLSFPHVYYLCGIAKSQTHYLYSLRFIREFWRKEELETMKQGLHYGPLNSCHDADKNEPFIEMREITKKIAKLTSYNNVLSSKLTWSKVEKFSSFLSWHDASVKNNEFWSKINFPLDHKTTLKREMKKFVSRDNKFVKDKEIELEKIINDFAKEYIEEINKKVAAKISNESEELSINKEWLRDLVMKNLDKAIKGSSEYFGQIIKNKEARELEEIKNLNPQERT